MKSIRITDKTLTVINSQLSFREKTEIAKQIDKLGVDVLELPQIKNEKTDILLAKNIANILEKTAVSIPTGFSKESVDTAFSCIKEAKKPMLNVALPMAPAQMEYVCGLKPDKMLAKITELIEYAKSFCEDVEFTALDSTRAEKEFLYSALSAAINSGAKYITLCDDAGVMDAEDFSEFIKSIYANAEGINDIILSVDIADDINMAVACCAKAIKHNATGVKVTSVKSRYIGIEDFCSFIEVKGEKLNSTTSIKTATLKNVCAVLNSFTQTDAEKITPYSAATGSSSKIKLNKNDDFTAVDTAIKAMGYDLNADDTAKVYDEFTKAVQNKDHIGTKEFEAIIATVAMQVPSTYHLVSYVINSGNIITATANLCVEKNGKKLNGVYVGDGPIDAAFLAIEQIVGHHFELDDFQIQSVTEGREAMGHALVKLRSDSGKLYSGNGISTDIIGASIKAYINALNKIVFEENR